MNTSFVNEGNVFMEAYYPQNIPYMKTIPRKMYLPKGTPMGKGNLCFLYSKSIDDSIKLMTSTENCISKNLYRLYYIAPRYKGKIKTTPYRLNMTNDRKAIYKEITKSTKIRPYQRLGIDSKEMRNMYFDMSKYLELFFTISNNKHFVPKIKIKEYWSYLTSVLTSVNNTAHTNRFIIVNIDDYPLVSDWKSNLENPLYIIYYTLFKMYDLCPHFDMDWYFYTGNRMLKINLKDLKKGDHKILKIQMLKIYGFVSKDNSNAPVKVTAKSKDAVKMLDEDFINQSEASNAAENKALAIAIPDRSEIVTIKNSDANSVVKDVQDIGGSNSEFITKSIKSKVAAVQKEVAAINDSRDDDDKMSEEEIDDYTDERVEEEINDDKELLSAMYDDINKSVVPSPPIMSARDKELKKKQKDLQVNGVTLDKLTKMKTASVKIPTKDVSNKMRSMNPHASAIKFNNFEKAYNEKVLPTDIVNTFLDLNNKSIPMYIRDIKVEDTSDELNYRDTYTVSLEDANRVRHTIKVDIPKFVDDKFIYINGSKKIIKHQEYQYPVIKRKEDTVQVATTYNKMTIVRKDTKSLGNIERLEALLKKNDDVKKYFKSGTRWKSNAAYITTIEYDELSKNFISFKCGKTEIYFSQKEALDFAERKNISVPEGVLFIGIDKDSSPIFIQTDDQLTKDGKSIVEIIIESLPNELQTAYAKIRPPKRLMHATVTIMNKPITIGSLLCYWEGLSTVLKKCKVGYRLSNKNDATVNEAYIKFADCYLIYKDNITSSLIFNGLRILETEKINFASMDTAEPYVSYFIKTYGRANVTNAFNNFYDFTIDPITREILEDIHLPTDLIELLIYAVSLLADSQYVPEINSRASRIRSNEIVPAILYDTIAKNYNNYRISGGKKKLSIPRDAVIKALVAVPTVEEYSTLNPILEMQTTHAVSAKGFRGVNNDEAYNIRRRTYDISMAGRVAPTQSPDATVGVSKTLTMEPTVTSVRGYVQTYDDNLKNLTSTNVFGPSELSIPLAPTLDDPTRMGHGAKQSGHVIPVRKSAPVLVSNGFEESVKYHLSSDFVVIADEDGEVVEINDEAKMIVVKYKSGKCRAVSLTGEIVKNGGGGFYLSNQLETSLKVGDKVKKDDVIAYHKDFFTNTKFNNCRMNMGTLAKVALMSTYNTYEDGTFITERLSQDAATEMCFPKQAVIGIHSNVEYMVKEGQHVNVGDPLIQFDTSYDDEELNSLLSNLGDDLQAAALANSRNTIQSKYAGVIESIKMYSPYDIDELSPSLQKIFRSYYGKINTRKRLLEKYDPDAKSSIIKCGILFNESTKRVEPNQYGTIKGQKVDEAVLIEIYIKHAEPLEVGSKIANFTGLKNTIDEIIPAGYEPYSSFREDESIDSIIASNSILKRMTPSIFMTVFCNKIVIELKRKLNDIYKSTNCNRAAMEKIIYDTFSAIDKTGRNTKYYKDLFSPMSDAQFKKYFKDLFEDEMAYLLLHVIEFEVEPAMPDIEKAAKVLNVPLFEYVTLPHITMDTNKPIVTPEPVPVGYILIKRTQQTVSKKNGISMGMSKRQPFTGQVTGVDKNGRESDIENMVLTGLGMNNVLKELNGPRADDLTAKERMLRDISVNGYTTLKDLPDDVSNKITLNTFNVYLLGMCINSDLITSGLMLKNTVKEEL